MIILSSREEKGMFRRTIGCPVGEGRPECVRGCGGWFRGYNSVRILQLLESGKLDPNKMPCGSLKEKAKRLLEQA